MLSPLIPERPLMVSPSLAANIGLEPAVLLHILSDILAHRRTFTFGGHQWAEVSVNELLGLAPFWQHQTLMPVLNRLVDLRILKVDPPNMGDQPQLRFALLKNTVPPSPPHNVMQHTQAVQDDQQQAAQTTLSTNQTTEYKDYSAPAVAAQDRAHEMPPSEFERQQASHMIANNADTHQHPISSTQQEPPLYPPHTQAQHATHQQHAATENTSQIAAPPLAEPTNTSPSWQPGRDLIDQISALGVPTDFLLNRVETFSIYRRESRQQSYSQDAAFRLFIMKEWRKEQTKYRAQPGQKHNLPAFLVEDDPVSSQQPPSQNNTPAIQHSTRHQRNSTKQYSTGAPPEWQKKPSKHQQAPPVHPQDTPAFLSQPQPKVIDKDWWPDEDAFKLQEGAGIDRQFLEDAVPEFVLYWRERGVPLTTWNTKFVAYTREQWAKITAVTAAEKELRHMSSDWYPSEDCFDILSMANIDIQFAKSLVKEFVMYWKDNRQVCKSWNTKFLQHVKYHWAKRHQLTPSRGQQGATHKNSYQQQPQNIEEQLTDRSWASEFFDETLS